MEKELVENVMGRVNPKLTKHDRILENDSFYWCECSEAIEHYYNKFDGFKIPNVYASSILESRNKPDAHSNITLDEDDYHYFRQIKNIEEPQRKIIYGFNNEETLKMVIRNRESVFNAWVERVEGRVNEDYDVPNIVDISFELVDIFSIYINEWGCEYFSHFALATLKKYMDLLKAEIDSDRHYSRYTKSEMIDTYELGMEWFEISNEFVLYKFG